MDFFKPECQSGPFDQVQFGLRVNELKRHGRQARA